MFTLQHKGNYRVSGPLHPFRIQPDLRAFVINGDLDRFGQEIASVFPRHGRACHLLTLCFFFLPILTDHRLLRIKAAEPQAVLHQGTPRRQIGCGIIPGKQHGRIDIRHTFFLYDFLGFLRKYKRKRQQNNRKHQSQKTLSVYLFYPHLSNTSYSIRNRIAAVPRETRFRFMPESPPPGGQFRLRFLRSPRKGSLPWYPYRSCPCRGPAWSS